MASVRYIILSACQSAGLYTQFGFESEAAAWLEKQGTNPCAYVYYRQGVGVAGFDNVSVAFGGSNPSAALRRVRDSLERSLEFRSERQTEVGGFPALEMTARAKKRVYGFGGGASPVPPTPTVDYMYFEAVEANSTVAMMSMLETAPNLEYSTDGVTWQEWQHTTADGAHTFDTLTLTAVGDRVYLRGDNPNGLGTFPEGAEDPLFSHFEMTGKIAAGGNIMSLLDKNAEMTEIPVFGFSLLFGDLSGENPNTSLTTAADMPTVTSIGDRGCDSMYYGCTSLTAATAVPSLTTIGDRGCRNMYEGCTSLTSATAMPAVTNIGESGCDSMYYGCTSLTAAAAMPQLTIIGKSGCANMYSDCTSLTAAAATPAVTTIGVDGCANMYNGCTLLTAAADLPAVTNIGESGCEYMYYGCTSLTAAANMPQLTTIGDNGCTRMYGDCTFDMSDDGTTLNFDFPTPPITAGNTTFSTAYDVAEWMGNTNGFAQPEASLFAPYTKRESGPGVYCLTINPRRINPDWQEGDVYVVCAVPDDSVTYGLKFSNLPNSSPESLSPSYEIDDAFITSYFDGTNLPSVYPQECADMIEWFEANKGKFYCEKKADDPNGLAGVTISIVEQDNPSNVLDTSEPMSDETTSCL